MQKVEIKMKKVDLKPNQVFVNSEEVILKVTPQQKDKICRGCYYNDSVLGCLFTAADSTVSILTELSCARVKDPHSYILKRIGQTFNNNGEGQL